MWFHCWFLRLLCMLIALNVRRRHNARCKCICDLGMYYRWPIKCCINSIHAKCMFAWQKPITKKLFTDVTEVVLSTWSQTVTSMQGKNGCRMNQYHHLPLCQQENSTQHEGCEGGHHLSPQHICLHVHAPQCKVRVTQLYLCTIYVYHLEIPEQRWRVQCN
jgi:hypothetical protein